MVAIPMQQIEISLLASVLNFKSRMSEDFIQEMKVRSASLEQKFTSGLARKLGSVLLVCLTILIPVEIVLYQKTYEDEWDKLKTQVRKQLSVIANLAVMGLDIEAHTEIFGPGDEELDEFISIRNYLRLVKQKADLSTEILTFRLEDASKRLAKFVVMTNDFSYVGSTYEYPIAMEQTIFKGEPAYTDFYESKSETGGKWMSAFAPFKEPDSEHFCVLEIDIKSDDYIKQFEKKMRWLKLRMILQAATITMLFLLIYYLIYRSVSANMRRLIGDPLASVIEFVERIGGGNLLSSLMIRSGDELELLGNSLNQMTSDLRQRETMRKFLTGMEMKEVSEISSGNKQMSYRGEKKSVTILFSDIRSFTTICEKSDPQLIIESLNFYFGKMLPIIEANGGSLDKLIGDAVMAVFESSDGYADADAGIRAAIEMQASMQHYRKEMLELGMPEFHIGIGVNTGISVIGNLGAKDQLSRTVLGDAVNLAARVEGLSKEGKQSRILFTENTKSQMKRDLPHQFLMETIVKGKSEPIKIYELDELVLNQ